MGNYVLRQLSLLIELQTKELGLFFLSPLLAVGESRVVEVGGTCFTYTNSTNIMRHVKGGFNEYACPATSSFLMWYHYTPVAGYSINKESKKGPVMQSHLSYCFYRHADLPTILVLLWLRTECNSPEMHCLCVTSDHNIHLLKEKTNRLDGGYFPDPNIRVSMIYAQMCIKYFELFMGPLELRNGTTTWIYDPLRPCHQYTKDPMSKEKNLRFDFKTMPVKGYSSTDMESQTDFADNDALQDALDQQAKTLNELQRSKEQCAKLTGQLKAAKRQSSINTANIRSLEKNVKELLKASEQNEAVKPKQSACGKSYVVYIL